MCTEICSGEGEEAQKSSAGVTFLCSNCSCPLYDEKYDDDTLLTLHLSRYREACDHDSQIWEVKIKSFNPYCGA